MKCPDCGQDMKPVGDGYDSTEQVESIVIVLECPAGHHALDAIWAEKNTETVVNEWIGELYEVDFLPWAISAEEIRAVYAGELTMDEIRARKNTGTNDA